MEEGKAGALGRGHSAGVEGAGLGVWGMVVVQLTGAEGRMRRWGPLEAACGLWVGDDQIFRKQQQ